MEALRKSQIFSKKYSAFLRSLWAAEGISSLSKSFFILSHKSMSISNIAYIVLCGDSYLFHDAIGMEKSLNMIHKREIRGFSVGLCIYTAECLLLRIVQE